MHKRNSQDAVLDNQVSIYIMREFIWRTLARGDNLNTFVFDWMEWSWKLSVKLFNHASIIEKKKNVQYHFKFQSEFE